MSHAKKEVTFGDPSLDQFMPCKQNGGHCEPNTCPLPIITACNLMIKDPKLCFVDKPGIVLIPDSYTWGH